MYKHIMLPYDGSPISERALGEAIALAKHSGGKITLINVVAPYHVPVPGDHTSSAVKELERQFLAELEKRAGEMLEAGQKRATQSGVSCESVVQPGLFPYEEIIEAAKNRKCDLIVMASHGRKGIQGLLIGSETTKVLTHCSIPVLVVR
jgi:nucleotide-binding universal stress UspA family protein